MRCNYRHTKIIFTMGPACADERVLERLILDGVDICRLNMAHAQHDWVEEQVVKIRKVSERLGRSIGIMMDIKGPEIRTGIMTQPVGLEEGDILDFVCHRNLYTESKETLAVDVNYPDLSKDIHVGDKILVDSGLIHLKALECHPGYVKAEVVIPGVLGSKRHINLPGVKVNLPSVTEKDIYDIELATRLGMSYIALSFVRDAKDVHHLRNILSKRGSKALIISKIEDQSAIENLESIVKATDALMVARGDLGIECPYEKLPIIQKRAVQLCIENAKPVIVATHMLESMINAPVPTRAEVSDVAGAIFMQADSIMLSGETSVGKYPIECVEVMDKIAREIEGDNTIRKESSSFCNTSLKTPKEKILHSAMVLAQEMDKAGLIVFTRNGYLARKLSSMRPDNCPIFAFTDDPLVLEQLRLSWGIIPYLIQFSHKDPESTISESIQILKHHEMLSTGAWLVIVTNVLAGARIIETIQMRQVD